MIKAKRKTCDNAAHNYSHFLACLRAFRAGLGSAPRPIAELAIHTRPFGERPSSCADVGGPAAHFPFVREASIARSMSLARTRMRVFPIE